MNDTAETITAQNTSFPDVDSVGRGRLGSGEARCIDRLYLHAYMPKLQTSGGLCYFLHDYLGHPIPSPALFRPMHDRFVTAVDEFVARHTIPVVTFESGQRKDDIVAATALASPPRGRRHARDRPREDARVQGPQTTDPDGKVTLRFLPSGRRGQTVYFYVHDRDWGPAFLKIGTYLPYPVKLCLNGHEWVKQHLRRQRVRFESLDNGFLSCADPVALAGHMRRAGPADVQAFFDRWSHRLPWPMPAGRPRGRLRPSPRDLSTRGESHAGLRPAGAGAASSSKP